jgi:hypothetical protein
MRSKLLMFALFIGPMAFAETYVCQMQKTNQSVSFKKLQNLPVSARSQVDTKAKYLLQLQTGELAFPSVSVEGIAITADVHFSFKSQDGKYQAYMYLDDGEGTLVYSNKKYAFSDCQYFKN